MLRLCVSVCTLRRLIIGWHSSAASECLAGEAAHTLAASLYRQRPVYGNICLNISHVLPIDDALQMPPKRIGLCAKAEDTECIEQQNIEICIETKCANK